GGALCANGADGVPRVAPDFEPAASRTGRDGLRTSLQHASAVSRIESQTAPAERRPSEPRCQAPLRDVFSVAIVSAASCTNTFWRRDQVFCTLQGLQRPRRLHTDSSQDFVTGFS